MNRTWRDATVTVELDDAWPEIQILIRSDGDSIILNANGLKALRRILDEVLPLLPEDGNES